VVAIMKLSRDWQDFTSKLDLLHAGVGDTIPLPLDDYQSDSGKGL
jgi:hypothetical protein